MADDALWIDKQVGEPEYGEPAREAVQAISAAEAELFTEHTDVILFDLRTSVATRFVVMPAPRHRHDQTCGHA